MKVEEAYKKSIETERLLKCVEMIQVLATKDSSDSIQCLPENPLNGVLDALCNKSASPQNSPDAKRRKPNETS
ncbi:hypothetical protein RJT34_23531 [Clitoria ternatea]|uniref:Uncharacterized protein n=1 Tax=Clitoria ternatea TaxID=43366 RepID=A0AAN9IL31_CLITE